MDGVIQGNQTTISASLTFQPTGAVPASPPAWSMTVAGVADMVVAPDGLSAVFTRSAGGAGGSTVVNVNAEGDPTPGVDPVHLQGTLTVMATEITSGSINFGPAS